MGAGRFIILANPAICCRCGKVLRTGRGAFWDAGSVTCVSCSVNMRGEAPKDPEEEQRLAEKLDEQEMHHI